MKRRAFTLFELLVAVGLIGVISALLWPVFARARENARKSDCQRNLKKIALGVKLYMNDWDERYPLVFVTNAPGPAPPYGWADALEPYINNPMVYQCPSDTNEANPSPIKKGYSDYWYNANLVYRRVYRLRDRPVFVGANSSVLGSSSQTVVAGDGGNKNGSGGHNSTYNQCGDGKSLSERNQVCAPSKSLTVAYPAGQIHLGGANFAFADGHVKWFRGSSAGQSKQIMSNRATQSNIGHKYTFSLLNR